jgi:formyl-CoA transferase
MKYQDHPDYGPYKMVGWPVRHNGATPQIKPAPLLGEHNEDVLKSWLGLKEGEVRAMKERGVI